MSDDGLRAALVAIKAKLQQRSDEGEAHLFLNIPYWELEELLAEYPAESPHLTDDGAAAPPADKGAANTPAAESATTTAAPSSPHPTYSEIKAAIRTGLGVRGRVDGCGCESHICAAADGVQAVFGEGATPAIDREALTELIAGRIHGSDHDQAATKCPGSEFCQLWFDAEQAASRVLPLLGGAS